MRRHSVRHSDERALGPVITGLALGFLAGFLIRGAVGGVDRRRLQTLREELTGAYPVRPLARAAVTAVRSALEREPTLSGIPFEVVAVGRGHVEVHGWVPSRSHRARAIRVAMTAAPDIDVTNRLSVRGEDDLVPADKPDALLPA
jgi:hypothetical protein